MLPEAVEKLSSVLSVPLVTREAFASMVGLPLGVVVAQCDRGYWPVVKVGRYSLVNLEAIRLKAAERAQEFVL